MFAGCHCVEVNYLRVGGDLHFTYQFPTGGGDSKNPMILLCRLRRFLQIILTKLCEGYDTVMFLCR